jgi:hypothetical protein
MTCPTVVRVAVDHLISTFGRCLSPLTVGYRLAQKLQCLETGSREGKKLPQGESMTAYANRLFELLEDRLTQGKCGAGRTAYVGPSLGGHGLVTNP